MLTILPLSLANRQSCNPLAKEMLFKVSLIFVLFYLNTLISGTPLQDNQAKEKILLRTENIISVNVLQSTDGTPKVIVFDKEYVLGIFFKTNWYRASQFCRYHGMHLASFTNPVEFNTVVDVIYDFGLNKESFWTSGNDLASVGDYFWMANGQPLTFTRWDVGEPDHPGAERCVAIWNNGVAQNPLMWHNFYCSTNMYFVCEKHL